MSNRLGEIVKAARGEVSLRDYAKQIGISHSYLSSIESGVNPSNGKPISIGLETIEKLSRVTGYSVSYLTGEKEKPTEPQDGIGELTEEEKKAPKWCPFINAECRKDCVFYDPQCDCGFKQSLIDIVTTFSNPG